MLDQISPNDFDWFKQDSNNDDDEVITIKHRETHLSKAFDSAATFILYILVVLVITRLFRFAFHENNLILYGFNFNSILNILIIFIAIFILTLLLLNLAGLFLRAIKQKKLSHLLDEQKRLIALFIWLLFGYLRIKKVEQEMHTLYNVTKQILLAGIATTVAYAIGTGIMNWFEKFFIKKTLSKKVTETEKTEKILKTFKYFRYGIEEVISSENEPYECPDLFNIDFLNCRTEEPISEESTTAVKHAKIKTPAIKTKHDAMRLAKDVFLKASRDGNKLGYKEFLKIFENKEMALSAYEYFNSDADHPIEKKSFRDVTLFFYRNRNILERSVQNTLHFVDMIRKVVFAVIFIFLFVFWMIIFGVPFRDLLALALSSALALNFVASGVLNESLRNIIMIFSHQFDIGDDVIIDDDLLTVYNIGMASTSFLCANGGKIKFLNSDLWRKTIINMTKAPKKILVFTFTLPPTISIDDISLLNSQVYDYLRERQYDFFDTFIMSSSNASSTTLENLPTSITLQCRGYKTKSRQFLLRAEFTAFLNELFNKFKIIAI